MHKFFSISVEFNVNNFETDLMKLNTSVKVPCIFAGFPVKKDNNKKTASF